MVTRYGARKCELNVGAGDEDGEATGDDGRVPILRVGFMREKAN